MTSKEQPMTRDAPITPSEDLTDCRYYWAERFPNDWRIVWVEKIYPHKTKIMELSQVNGVESYLAFRGPIRRPF
jgi:hypothetical protein